MLKIYKAPGGMSMNQQEILSLPEDVCVDVEGNVYMASWLLDHGFSKVCDHDADGRYYNMLESLYTKGSIDKPLYDLHSALFPNISHDKIVYELMERDTMKEFLIAYAPEEWVVPHWKFYKNGSCFVPGFTIFPTNEFLSCQNCSYLVAHTENRILGIIKFGQFKHEKCQIVSYIDVCEPYWGMGIARNMIRKLNEVIDKSLPLALTELTDDGERIHIDQVFKQELDVEVLSWTEACQRNLI